MNNPFDNKPQDILSSWIALEVLSPQTFRKPEDLTGTYGSIANLMNGKLPWDGNGEQSKPNYRLYYQIILGTIDFAKAIGKLLDVYADKRVERPATEGEAILAVAVVDSKGCLVEDPAIAISSFAWGVPQALKGDLRKLSDWMTAENKLRIDLDKILRRTDKEGRELPLDAPTLKTAKDYLIKMLGLPTELITGNTFAVRAYEYITSREAPDPILLNSFYIGDLMTASNLFKEGTPTVNLQRYIGMKLPGERKDLLHDPKALEQALAPSIMPPARWPGSGRHPLVVLQQAAVNLALQELKTDGILAVNGPPGTGKTTLLRDIVAAVVSNRAEVMCTFDDPADAFTDSGEKMKAGQGWLYFYELDKKLQGFEIVIASSNNKAVENVSAELPGINAIAGDADDLRYFKCLSDTLLERESWGLIAAVLGNATNRSRFRQTFWWDKEVGLSAYLAEAAGTPQIIQPNPTSGENGDRPPQIVTAENPPKSHEEALERWRVAKIKFRSALDKSRAVLSQLEEIRKAVLAQPILMEAQALAERDLNHGMQDENRTQQDVDKARIANRLGEVALEDADRSFSQHRKIRPGFFERIFRTARAVQWRQKHDTLSSILMKAKAECEERSKILTSCLLSFEKAKAAVSEFQEKLSKASLDLNKADQTIIKNYNQLGAHYIDGNFFKLTHPQRQIQSPWCSMALQRVRDDVFIAAMQLHKAFIDAAAKPLKHNLGILMSVFSGKSLPDRKKQDLLIDLWSSLFLVVPSVSTTFASVERMLGSLPVQSLGWLLIDEAGQALPQAAVGALMRTKRAIIVGDPLQIEPVVTLPETLTKSICHQFSIDPDRFNAPEASAQTLADTATLYFTEFEGKHGSRSVGVPLLVHRRCQEPMFSVSNTIAYERLMVQAKKPGSSPIRDFLGPSRWIDVRGQAQDKWCREEGQIVLDMLRQFRTAGIAPNLYIVTPFVIVADGLRKLIRDSGILNGWVDDEDKWPKERIGTVHTVQGREAEAVIFVLGAPHPDQIGARGWAGGRPNLLNVAVTRAKEAIYIVGNRQLWREAGLFSELSDRIG